MNLQGGYYPVVVDPGVRPQTSPHLPFYFGGSQVPMDLGMNRSKGGRISTKYAPSATKPGDMDYTTKMGDKVYHPKGTYMRISGKLPYMNK